MKRDKTNKRTYFLDLYPDKSRYLIGLQHGDSEIDESDSEVCSLNVSPTQVKKPMMTEMGGDDDYIFDYEDTIKLHNFRNDWLINNYFMKKEIAKFAPNLQESYLKQVNGPSQY